MQVQVAEFKEFSFVAALREIYHELRIVEEYTDNYFQLEFFLYIWYAAN